MVETPYECEVVFMHEGASGGGKSEMLEDFHREEDDRLLIGTHTVTGEKYYMTLGESCKIHPIADDMGLRAQELPGSRERQAAHPRCRGRLVPAYGTA